MVCQGTVILLFSHVFPNNNVNATYSFLEPENGLRETIDDMSLVFAHLALRTGQW
jgi:hypothetical protein